MADESRFPRACFVFPYVLCPFYDSLIWEALIYEAIIEVIRGVFQAFCLSPSSPLFKEEEGKKTLHLFVVFIRVLPLAISRLMLYIFEMI